MDNNKNTTDTLKFDLQSVIDSASAEAQKAKKDITDAVGTDWNLGTVNNTTRKLVSSSIIKINRAIEVSYKTHFSKGFYEIGKKDANPYVNLKDNPTTKNGLQNKLIKLISFACTVHGLISEADIEKKLNINLKDENVKALVKKALEDRNRFNTNVTAAVKTNCDEAVINEIKKEELEIIGIKCKVKEEQTSSFMHAVTLKINKDIQGLSLSNDFDYTEFGKIISDNVKVSKMNATELNAYIKETENTLKLVTSNVIESYIQIGENIHTENLSIHKQNSQQDYKLAGIEYDQITELKEAANNVYNNNGNIQGVINKNNLGLTTLNGGANDKQKLKLIKLIASGKLTGSDIALEAESVSNLLTERLNKLTKNKQQAPTELIEAATSVVEGKTPSTPLEIEIASIRDHLTLNIKSLRDIIQDGATNLATTALQPTTEPKVKAQKFNDLLQLHPLLAGTFDPRSNDNRAKTFFSELKNLTKFTDLEKRSIDEYIEDKTLGNDKRTIAQKLKTINATFKLKTAPTEKSKEVKKAFDTLLQHVTKIAEITTPETDITMYVQEMAESITARRKGNTFFELEETLVNTLMECDDSTYRNAAVNAYMEAGATFGDKESILKAHYDEEGLSRGKLGSETKFHIVCRSSEDVAEGLESRINNVRNTANHMEQVTKDPVALANSYHNRDNKRDLVDSKSEELNALHSRQEHINSQLDTVCELLDANEDTIIEKLSAIVNDEQKDIISRMDDHTIKVKLMSIKHDLEADFRNTSKGVSKLEEEIDFNKRLLGKTDKKAVVQNEDKEFNGRFGNIGSIFETVGYELNKALRDEEATNKEVYPEQNKENAISTTIQEYIVRKQEKEGIMHIVNTINSHRSLIGVEELKVEDPKLYTTDGIKSLIKEADGISLVAACSGIKKTEDVVSFSPSTIDKIKDHAEKCKASNKSKQDIQM